MFLAKGSYEYTLFTLYPGVSVKFHLDGLGVLFAGTSSFLWIMAGFYCMGYMRGLNEHAQTRFYFCYAVAVGGAMGVAFSANLFYPVSFLRNRIDFYLSFGGPPPGCGRVSRGKKNISST